MKTNINELPPAITRDGLPVELASALDNADSLLAEFDRRHNVLVGTSQQIPGLLGDRLLARSECGSEGLEGDGVTGETQARLRGIDEALQSQVNVRAASVEACSEMKVDLMRQHDKVKRASVATLDEVKVKLRQEYDAAVAKLQSFWAQGDALSKLLGADIDLPIPAKIREPKIEQFTNQPYWGIEPVVLQRIGGKDVTVVLDPTVHRIANTLARLHRASEFGVGVRDVQTREGSYVSRRQIDGGVHSNIYVLAKPQVCYLSGYEFPAGTLISTALFEPGHLSRFAHAKHCRIATAADVLAQSDILPEAAPV